MKITSAQVTIISPPEVDTLMQKLAEQNAESSSYSGYRVQVFVTNERKKALEVKAELLENFPDADVKMVYQQPNFKIRIGEFRTRIDAQQLYQEVLKKFPLAFIVPDKIDIVLK